MIGITSATVPRAALDERAILRIGLAISVAYLLAAMVVALLSAPAIRWSSLHLALAGASMVAIGTFMPHFGVTLAGAAPSSPGLRLAGVLLLASGAGVVVTGVAAGLTWLAFVGAGAIWVGLGVTAWTTFVPARNPLARRHPLAQTAYAVALIEVAVGIGLPVLLLAGWSPVVAGWPGFKAAHVWLNLFGFVSVTIVATLVYLYPTIAGARIRMHPSLMLMVGGTVLGAPVAAAGSALDWPPLATAGAVVAVAGALGQLVYAFEILRRRAGWTSDLDWHRLTIWHITAGMAWYLAALLATLAGILRDGPAPEGWALGAVALPLVAGWALQVLVGTASHLLPAMVTTRPVVRGAQRLLLGRAATLRLVAWNGGVLLAWLGLSAGVGGISLLGFGLLGLSVAVAMARLVRALLIGGIGRA
jgi:nitrite reductase (NO-forming)